MELFAWAIVAAFTINMAFIGFLRLRVQKLEATVAAHRASLRMLYDEVCPIIDPEDDDEIPF